MPTAQRAAVAVIALALVAACLAGCVSGPSAQGSGLPSSSAVATTPAPTPVSTPSPWPTRVASRPAPELAVPHECPTGTQDVLLVAEARTERAVLKTLRVCSGPDHVVVINAGPLVWIIDSPELMDGREPSSFAAAAFHQALVTRYEGRGIVAILPGEEIGLSDVEAADLHLRLDADIQSLWLIASEVSASTPGQLTDQATGAVSSRTAKLVATCSLKSLAPIATRLTPDDSSLRLARLLLTTAKAACAPQFAELDRLSQRAAPSATPVGERLAQRADTLRLSRPTATAEAWGIRLLRFITTFGARAAA